MSLSFSLSSQPHHPKPRLKAGLKDIIGGTEWTNSNINSKTSYRLGFLGLQKDKESNLGDHGVRKYDSEIGRFLAIDPLWEQYNAWNPYQYSGNSPIGFKDINGAKITTTDFELQDLITKTVPTQFRKFVVFNSDGVLDYNKLSEADSKDLDINSNFKSLMRLAQNETEIKLQISTEVDYKDLESNKKTGSLYMNFGSGGITLAPHQHKFYQLAPTQNEWSRDNSINIFLGPKEINYGENLINRLCEELYGHARMFLQGSDPRHHKYSLNGNKYEGNTTLNWYIQNSQDEIEP